MGFEREICQIRGETRCATRKGGVPDVEFKVGKGSADVDGGAGNVTEGSKAGPWRADGG